MSQIKTFDDMLDCEPKLKLGELIQLFLLVRYYDCYIERLEDPCDINTILGVVLYKEAIHEESTT